MTSIPSVSVIVPIYKVERYIKKCVDSILAQTFQDFEIILVDDASPDGCVELCQKLYGDNEKVRLVRHEKNLGLGPARNTGMKNAVGKYIYFVDSDDYLLPAALEKCFNAAEKFQADVVHMAGRYNLTEKDGAPASEKNLQLLWEDFTAEGFLPNNVIYRLEKHWKTYATRSNAWLCFCRRDFMEKNHIEFLDIISEDEPFSFALFCFAKRYYILREAQYVHLVREGSIMRTHNLKRFSDGIYAMLVGAAYIEKILDRFPKFNGCEIWRENFMAEFFKRFLNNHTAPFYSESEITPEMNERVEKVLSPVFGKASSFVKYFFNQFHLYRRQSEILLKQRNQIANQFAVLQQQNQRLNKTLSTFVREQAALSEIIDALKTDGKRILLMGTPDHGNLGDQAIALGELHILKMFFPEHNVVEIPRNYLTGELADLLFGLGFEKYVRRDDVIFWHGGGNLGNLWLQNENIRRLVIEKFPHNKIVIFPQSICFTADDAGRRELARSQKIYNAHGDLHLMTRDEISFGLAKKFFPAVKNYLLPDAVTVLQGMTDDVDLERKGVLFVLRRDKEKVRDDATIKRIQDYLAAKNIPFTVTDTVVDGAVTLKTREQKVRDMLLKIRGSKLVVTDRFHGVVFSFVTRTPVLAFKSFDTKISSGIKWFKDFPSIFYAESQDMASVEKFIDENYSAVDEKISDESDGKLNASEKFFAALKKIVRPADVADGKKKSSDD